MIGAHRFRSRERKMPNCPHCEVPCGGEGFLMQTLTGALVTVAVAKCPECGRLVPMEPDHYLDAKQRAFLARVNEGGVTA